ncbi:MAG: hypothetical protein H7Y05_15020 [Steroidobacteraceae bacterium]|nr:hypothetical protein [Deltaproteobacteria bacterium]
MEAISLPFVQLIIQLLGLPGLIFIIWHFDNKRLDKQRGLYEEQQHLLRVSYEKEHKADRDSYEKGYKYDRDQVNTLMGCYRDDVASIKQLYANNAHLVGDYDKAMNRLEKIAADMMSVVSLNAHTNTQLADAIKHNTFCPQVRILQGTP